MNTGLLANLALFSLALVWILRRQRAGAPFSRTVLVALLLGAALGAGFQGVWGLGSPTLNASLAWIGLVGGGYVRLLQMIVIPLVLVSILSAVTRLGDARALGRISAGVLGVLMATTAVSALVGVGVTRLFRLRADGLLAGTREQERGLLLETRLEEVAAMGMPELFLSLIPTNPFADLAGSRPTSVLGVVFFAALLGVAALVLQREEPELGARVIRGIEGAQALILRLVRMVIRLTPFGVLALMTRVAATSNLEEILNLVAFVGASYVGLALILALHLGLLALVGVRPADYLKGAWPALSFAFTSRSSAATIPLTVESQIRGLGVPSTIASFSAVFGSTIGQNGCAGLYPAMLAMMIAPSVGVDPLTPGFLFPLVLVVTLTSFGIAGVGGGATFAALLVLSTLGLPVALAGLLISIEPLIDMGRTAINVSGSMTAGVVTDRLGLGTESHQLEKPPFSPATETLATSPGGV